MIIGVVQRSNIAVLKFCLPSTPFRLKELGHIPAERPLGSFAMLHVKTFEEGHGWLEQSSVALDCDNLCLLLFLFCFLGQTFSLAKF